LDSKGGDEDEEKKDEIIDLESFGSSSRGSGKKAGNGHGGIGLSNELDLTRGTDRNLTAEDSGQLSFRSI